MKAKAGSDIGKSVLATLCTFANELSMGGGWLPLAVAYEVRAWRAEEIAALLSRNAETVPQNYLRPPAARRPHHHDPA